MKLSTLVILIFVVCIILFCAVYMHEEDEPVVIEYTHVKEVKVPVVKTVYVDRPTPRVVTPPVNSPSAKPTVSVNPDDYVDKIL